MPAIARNGYIYGSAPNMPIDANDVSYNHTSSELESTDVQSAIDELKEIIDENPGVTYTLGTNENNITLTPSDGQAQSITAPYATSAGDASTVNGKTVAANVPADAVFTDTTYENATTSADGLMSSTDKGKVDALGTASTKNVPTSGNASTTEVVMGNDTRLTDARNAADVSAWAKADTKPSYTAAEVGAIATTAKGANNGVAELDSTGKVPSSQLPSFVDDVLEYNSSSDFPLTGESGKIYIAKDTNKTYRWSGSAYTEISESLALGETSSTAYRGDRGKTAYDHSQTTGNPHSTSKSDIGLGNVANYDQSKAIKSISRDGLTFTATALDGSTISFTQQDNNTTYSNATTATAGLMSTDDKTKLNGIASGAEVNQNAFSNVKVGSTTVSADGKTDTLELVGSGSVTITPDATNDKITISATNTTYSNVSTSAAGLAPKVTDTSKYLKGDGTWATPTNTTYSNVSTSAAGLAPKVTNTSNFLKGDGTWATPTNTTYSNVSTSAAGLAPKVTDTGKFLKGDGTWATPTNTTYSNVSSASAGLAPKGAAVSSQSQSTKFLREDGSWAAPSYTTNTNTTYTFANGTNGFTVTPSGGTAQTVTVTPSITNNVTGSGTSGYIAKFNGGNTITNGPAIGSDTTKYLRNDGTWVKPPNDNTWTAMVGATSAANGSVGYVNAVPPKNGYNTKYLRADGTWAVPPDTVYAEGLGITINGTIINNDGVRSIAEGTTIGTVSVNTGGTTADVAVKGLKGGAFKAVDTELTQGSANLITSGAVKGAVDTLTSGLTNLAGSMAAYYWSGTTSDNRYYKFKIKSVNLSATRIPFIILLNKQNSAPELVTCQVVRYNQTTISGMGFSSEKVTFDSATNTITIDAGASAYAQQGLIAPYGMFEFDWS